MNSAYIQYEEKRTAPQNYYHPIKLTALLYLREGLQKEVYEQCDDIICIAKLYGAAESDVRKIIDEYLYITPKIYPQCQSRQNHHSNSQTSLNS